MESYMDNHFFKKFFVDAIWLYDFMGHEKA